MFMMDKAIANCLWCKKCKRVIPSLAQVGAMVKPGTKDEFKIKQSSIGEKSFGMLCSERIRDNNESDGIIELGNDLEAGKSFRIF